MSAFLNYEGLQHYDSRLKQVVGGTIQISGRTIKLLSVSGAVIGEITVPETVYSLATSQKDGLLSSADFTKLSGISEGATKVANSATNGNIQIDGQETKVYEHPTVTAGALVAGLYKITTDASGHVTLGTAVSKSDITALGIPGQDTTYGLATGSANGLMSSSDFTKLSGIAAGAQVNVLEKVSVNGSPLGINSKGVNIDLSDYAKKTDIASAVNYRGSVENYSDLPSSPAKGDMYNVVNEDKSHGIAAGINVVWNGTSWDPMAPMFNVEGIGTSEIDALFA